MLRAGGCAVKSKKQMQQSQVTKNRKEKKHRTERTCEQKQRKDKTREAQKHDTEHDGRKHIAIGRERKGAERFENEMRRMVRKYNMWVKFERCMCLVCCYLALVIVIVAITVMIAVVIVLVSSMRVAALVRTLCGVLLVLNCVAGVATSGTGVATT